MDHQKTPNEEVRAKGGQPPRRLVTKVMDPTQSSVGAEIVAWYKDRLQLYSFELSNQELFIGNNEAAELDPQTCLIVNLKKPIEISPKTRVGQAEEIRSAGDTILLRTPQKLHVLQRDFHNSQVLKSLESKRISPAIRMALPQNSHPRQVALIDRSGKIQVLSLPDLQTSHSTEIEGACCGAWAGEDVLLTSSKEDLVLMDLRQAHAQELWTGCRARDIAPCPWRPYEVAVTASLPWHTVRVFDLRTMRPLQQVALPERGELFEWNYPLHEDRYFEVDWVRGERTRWMHLSCLGGYDIVGLGESIHEEGKRFSFHSDGSDFRSRQFDVSVGAPSVVLNDAQDQRSAVALVNWMVNTGPRAKWLESPLSATEDALARPELELKASVASFIGCMLHALGDEVPSGIPEIRKQWMLDAMLSALKSDADCRSLFPFLWSLLAVELRDLIESHLIAFNKSYAMVALGKAGDIHILFAEGLEKKLSLADLTESLTESRGLQWHVDQLQGKYRDVRVIALMLGYAWLHRRIQHSNGKFELSCLADIEARGQAPIAPLVLIPEKPPDNDSDRHSPPHDFASNFGWFMMVIQQLSSEDEAVDNATVHGMSWLQCEEQAVFQILRACGDEEEFQDPGGQFRHVLQHRKWLRNRRRRQQGFRRKKGSPNPSISVKYLAAMEAHELQGPLDDEDKRLMDLCLLERNPGLVASWCVRKRLRGVMFALKLADLPHGWQICEDCATPCNVSLADLVQIGKAEEENEGHHKLAAKSGARILLRALVTSGLLTCNSHVPNDPEDPQAASAASEVHCVTQGVVDPKRRTTLPQGDQKEALERHGDRLQKRLSIQQRLACKQLVPVPENPSDQMHERMHLLMKQLLESPTLAWQNSLLQQCPELPEETTERQRRHLEKLRQKLRPPDARGPADETGWQQMLIMDDGEEVEGDEDWRYGPLGRAGVLKDDAAPKAPPSAPSAPSGAVASVGAREAPKRCDEVKPRTIWAYWAQGHQQLPEFFRMCVDTWQRLNPHWDVRILQKSTVLEYLTEDELPNRFQDMTSHQTASDAVRFGSTSTSWCVEVWTRCAGTPFLATSDQPVSSSTLPMARMPWVDKILSRAGA
eukprot:Skav208665  [mRNA]  locus=scaffold3341:100740:112064:+ [translate_table: standard]